MYTSTSNESASEKYLRSYVTGSSGVEYFDQSSQQDAAEFLQYLDSVLSSELQLDLDFTSLKQMYWVGGE